MEKDTPLGRPVEPEVNMTVATSSSRKRRRLARRASMSLAPSCLQSSGRKTTQSSSPRSAASVTRMRKGLAVRRRASFRSEIRSRSLARTRLMDRASKTPTMLSRLKCGLSGVSRMS